MIVNDNFRNKLLTLALKFDYAICLEDAVSKKLLVAFGADKKYYKLNDIDFERWFFGHISYDYKNKIENLVSENSETISFTDVLFFVPKNIICLENNNLSVVKSEKSSHELVEQIMNIKDNYKHFSSPKLLITPKQTYSEYIKNVKQLQKHIKRGDIYEINYCQEFVAKNAKINVLSIFDKLLKISPMPFACILKEEEKYALCSSPERYIQKRGNILTSQPIKGTAPRGNTVEEDISIIKILENNAKEKSENIMAVDVVRNDLARIANRGTVKVKELCKVYTFRQLHQMTSTVSACINNSTTLEEIINATFPMASMTGAPKLKAMQLIEQYENSKRGLYSGSIGYITPRGNFDFNVVIRTILYDNKANNVSFTVGSAITTRADAEQEYQECMLKANAIMNILT